MNDFTPEVATEMVGLDQSPLGLDHFILGLDDEGNEVKIKVDPTGELVQDVEDKDEVVLN